MMDEKRDFVGIANIYTGAIYIAPGMTLNHNLYEERPMQGYLYQVGKSTLPTEFSNFRNQKVGTLENGSFYNKAGHQQLLDVLGEKAKNYIGFYGTVNRHTKTIKFGYNSNVCNSLHCAGSRTVTSEYRDRINDGFKRAGWSPA